jgi:X-X-X-Leu-X-X-Gly heptad repeat protein
MNRTTITAAAAFLALAAPQAFAAAHSQADIKVLNDSAEALAPNKPDLSAGLKELAARETGEKEQTQKEPAEVQQQDIRLLDQSAAALKDGSPDLSDGLKKLADQERQEMQNPNQPHQGTTPQQGTTP